MRSKAQRPVAIHLLKLVLMVDGRSLTLQVQPASVLLSYRKIAQKCSADKENFFSYGRRGHFKVIRS
jgi:hypothetical protein